MRLSRKHVLRQHLTPLIPSKSAQTARGSTFGWALFSKYTLLNDTNVHFNTLVGVEILKINKNKINHMIGAQRGPMRAQFPAREF